MNELEVKAQEEHVGLFRADILCVDPGTDKYVLIENQLEKTDHNHLGQILTYAAGLDAVTIIWIAEHFTEEHRAAIDKKFFDELYKYKNEAETAIGKPLDWRRLDEKKASSIDLYKYCDLSESHEELFEWYKEYTEKFILFFKPIIKKI